MFPSAAGIVPNPKLGAPGSHETIIPHVRRCRSDEGGVAVASTAMQLLRTAEGVLRPLGDSRALAMVLRGIAREWVREWATVVLKGGNGQARARAVAVCIDFVFAEGGCELSTKHREIIPRLSETANANHYRCPRTRKPNSILQFVNAIDDDLSPLPVGSYMTSADCKM